jgi:hypothetical protein
MIRQTRKGNLVLKDVNLEGIISLGDSASLLAANLRNTAVIKQYM